MKNINFIKQICLFAACFLCANLFAVFIYAQVYTYILRVFSIGEYAGHIAYLAGLLVSYFHMMCVFTYGNSGARKNFFEKRQKILSSLDFWVANAMFFAMTLIFAPDFALFHITAVLFPAKTLTFAAKKAIISLLMIFVNFGLLFLAQLFVRAKWRAEGEESEASRGAGKIFLRVLAAFLFYLFLLGVVIRFAVTMAFYTGLFFRILLFFVPALLAILLFWCAVSAVKCKRFRRKTEEACRKNGFSFCVRAHGVVGAEINGKKYAFKIIGAEKIFLVLYAVFSRIKFLKKYADKLFLSFAFKAKSDERKIFVLLPVFGKAQTGRFTENGEYFGEYRVFYAKPFLRALENDFLER